MSIYAGLDVSDKTTHVWVVDGEGAVLRREVLASDPDVIAKWLGRYCPDLVRVVLETGPLSAFLYHGMVARDVPVECICARHAKGVRAAPRTSPDAASGRLVDLALSHGLSFFARQSTAKKKAM